MPGDPAAARRAGFDGPILTTDASYFRTVDEADVQNSYTMQPRFGSVDAAFRDPSGNGWKLVESRK